ncbi:MAG: molybdopterin molybdotransferase MoeA [Thermovirgaceae bacterium]
MNRFVTETLSREEAIHRITSELGFPWPVETEEQPLSTVIGMRAGRDILSLEEHPPFDRSLRDGYALFSRDTTGASWGSPAFLKVKGSIPMGKTPDFALSPGEAAGISTGGCLPEGADAVLMMEDSSILADTLEVRRSLQSGENIIRRAEEVRAGERLLEKGKLLDFRSINLLSSFGFSNVPVIRARVAILSTGDELVPPGTSPLAPGKIRDANGGMIAAVLEDQGFTWRHLGIVPDDPQQLNSRFSEALEEDDIIFLSGGSSVSARDFTSTTLESLKDPGLVVRGLNISPGKPTLVGGNTRRRKLAVGLPGHPLSCAVVMWTFVLPLLLALITGYESKEDELFQKVELEVGKEIFGRTGVEEFFPARIEKNRIIPLIGKSGYVGAMARAAGLARLPVERETVRTGEKAEVWLW